MINRIIFEVNNLLIIKCTQPIFFQLVPK